MTVAGRACGDCTLCCGIFEVPELRKPRAVMCKHCVVGQGCTIHEKRPQDCRNFFCAYLMEPTVADYWYPLISNMVIIAEPRRITVHVDPAHPDAWRQDPYRRDLRRWVMQGAATLRQIIIYVGRHGTLMLPERNVDMGEMNGDEHIVTMNVMGPIGVKTEVLVLKPGDPRLEELRAKAAAMRGAG